MRPSARNTILLAGLLLGLACVISCVSRPVDPTDNSPLRPTETMEANEKPAAIAATSSARMLGEPAHNDAVKLEISTLSNVSRGQDGRVLVDIRFDTLDGKGNFAAIAGELRIVITASTGEPAHQIFDVPLVVKTEVARRFDSVLSQYVMRLEPEWDKAPQLGEELRISATLTTPTGSVLESSARMRW